VVGIIAGAPVPGEDAYRDQIVQQIEATGLGRRLQWVGHLDPVEPLYHACDIVVSTSEYETFGNSVCEAMACRRPVVGYEAGSVKEVVGDAGITVPTGDLPMLTAAVRQLVENPALRHSLGEAARQRVADSFDPRKSFQQLLEIYQSIVGPSPQPRSPLLDARTCSAPPAQIQN
jgi:glycosyltransferase involved in cell wall biosynthesis